MVLDTVSGQQIGRAQSTVNAWAVEIVAVVWAKPAIVAGDIGCASRVYHANSDCAHRPATLVTWLALSDSMHHADYANDRAHCDSVAYNNSIYEFDM